jgi:alditol oxidase
LGCEADQGRGEGAGLQNQNWSNTYAYQAARLHRPTSIDEVRRIVVGATRVHALGARHSFNSVADTTGDLIDVSDIRSVPAIDHDQRTVTVGAGTRYGELAAFLHAHGLALHNMASLPHISVAGAVATGTHGSGNRNGNLATAVAGLEIVTAGGDLVQIRRGERGFNGMVVGLGAFGVVTRVTLDVEPSFEMQQDVFAGLPWTSLLTNFDAIMAAAYSVSLMTMWSESTVNRLWLKTRLADGEPSRITAAHFGATATTRASPGAVDVDESLTPFGVPGPWSERLCHFRPDCEPGPISQIQSEYMLPRSQATAALTRLKAIAERVDRHLIISEIRTIAADDLWLSPSYGHESIALHFTWKPDPVAADAITAEIEALLLPLGGRPHWGKLMHARAAQIAPLYPQLAEFRSLADEYDPAGKFRNQFLTEHVFG